MMVFNKHGKVFVGLRLDTVGEIAWQMPQGGVESQEDLQVAALRELKEEIGTDKVEIVAESSGWYTYNIPSEIAYELWDGKYIGQRQKWFLMRFVGDDGDINIHTSHPEFKEWRWSEIEDLCSLIVSFKRQLYQDVVTEFAPVIRDITPILG